jgi:hypothetical protein
MLTLRQPEWMCPVLQALVVHRNLMEINQMCQENNLLFTTWSRFYSAFWRFQRLEGRFDPRSRDYVRIMQLMQELNR